VKSRVFTCKNEGAKGSAVQERYGVCWKE